MRRRARVFTRGKKDYCWSAVLVQTTNVVAGAQATPILLQASDWAPAGTDRGTLLRIRGSIAFSQITTTANPTVVRWAVWKQNAGETLPDLTVVGNYVDEDYLGGGVVPGLSGAIPNPPMAPIEIDIKARRKIDQNTQINLVVRPTGNDINYSLLVRCLVNKT